MRPTEKLNTTWIYGLVDPRTQIIRYVGKSNNPVARLKAHLKDCQKCRRVNWLKSLARLGLYPEMIILEEVVYINWQDAECKWIKHFRKQGICLTNSTDGGDGLNNPNKETRRKLSNTLMGRIVSSETRRKMSEARMGYIMPEEIKHKISETNTGKQLGKTPWNKGLKFPRRACKKEEALCYPK